MPVGKKVIVFMSTTKPEYTTSIECLEVNPLALIALIPSKWDTISDVWRTYRVVLRTRHTRVHCAASRVQRAGHWQHGVLVLCRRRLQL